MKARIKKTGEIINLAEYAKIELDVCDSFGNPIELKPEDVELVQEKTDNNDWNQVRIQAAIAAMQGLCNSCHDDVIREIQKQNDLERSSVIGFLSVRIADALVEELKKEQE